MMVRGANHDIVADRSTGPIGSRSEPLHCRGSLRDPIGPPRESRQSLARNRALASVVLPNTMR